MTLTPIDPSMRAELHALFTNPSGVTCWTTKSLNLTLVRDTIADERNAGNSHYSRYISKVVSEKMAYTITIQRAQFLLAGRKKPTLKALRVAHIYRKEADSWNLRYRHADPFLKKESTRR